MILIGERWPERGGEAAAAAEQQGESIGRHGSPGLIKFHSDFSNYPVAARRRLTRFPRWPGQARPGSAITETQHASPWNSLYRARSRPRYPVRCSPFLIALPPQSVFHAVPALREIQWPGQVSLARASPLSLSLLCFCFCCACSFLRFVILFEHEELETQSSIQE